MDVTSLLKATGGDGRFQVVITLITQLVRVATVSSLYFMAFGIYLPPWNCLDQEGYDIAGANHSDTFIFSVKLNYSDERTRHFLSQGNNTSDADGGFSSRRRNGSVPSESETDTCDAFKSCRDINFSPDSSTVASEWHLNCDSEWIGSMMITLQMVGHLCGSFSGGQLAERYGRKFTFLSFNAFLSVLTIVSSFSGRWEVFTGLRFLIGICTGGIFSICVVYNVEFLGSKGRNALKILPIYGFGMFTYSILVYFIRDWKLLSVAIGIMSGLLCIPLLWVPESMRWLHVKGKKEQMEHVARKISKFNGQRAFDFEVDVDADCHVPEVKYQYSYIDLFRGWFQTRVTLSIMSTWVVQDMVHFMLGLSVKAFSGDFYVNLMIYSFSELPVFIVMMPAVKLMGNRCSISLFFFLTFIASFSIVILHLVPPFETKGTVIMYMALVARFLLAATNQLMVVITSELFPTVIRSVGYAFCGTMGIVGAAVAPFLIPSTSNSMLVCFSIVSGFLLFVSVLLLSMPETKSKALKDFVNEGETQNGPQVD